MSMTIPTFRNPYDLTGAPLADVFGWIRVVCLDAATGVGRVVLSLNPNPAASGTSPPIAEIPADLGAVLVAGAPPAMDGSTPEVPAVKFATLDELLADPEFAQAFGVILARLEREFLKVPELAQATINP
jgi:hypothetical protein